MGAATMVSDMEKNKSGTIIYNSEIPLFSVHLKKTITTLAYLRDIVGSVSDHSNKANITIKQMIHLFCFPVHIKVTIL